MITDVHARYFGAELDNRSLNPSDKHRIAPTRFDAWLRLDPSWDGNLMPRLQPSLSAGTHGLHDLPDEPDRQAEQTDRHSEAAEHSK